MAIQRLLVLGFAFAACTTLAARLSQAGEHGRVHGLPPTASFSEYVTVMGRTYTPGSEEWVRREELFKQRAGEVRLQNARPNRLWTAHLNFLSDRTGEELSALRGWRHGANGSPHTAPAPANLRAGAHAPLGDRPLPTTVDWSTLQTAFIDDQLSCGSCWAMATVKMMETRYEIAMQTPRTFSAQQLVNCVKNEQNCGGTGGCEGATVELALSYVTSEGLRTEDEVPYTSKDGECTLGSSSLLAAGDNGDAAGAASIGMTSWSTLPSNKALPLMMALLDGPVAVAIAADTIYSYWTGVFDSCAKDAVINHAVTLVAYGQNESTKYWTIQNSWGEDWGEEGRMRVLRHDTTEEDDAWCGTDYSPEDGIECIPYPDSVTVCGVCGILYDSVVVHFSPQALGLELAAAPSNATSAALAAALRGAVAT